MSDEIFVDPLIFIPSNPKEALEWIKEARKNPLDKAIEKMETSIYYQFFIDDVELLD